MVKVVQNTDIPGIPTLEIFPLIEGLGYDGVDYLTYIKNFYLKPKKILHLSNKHKLPVLTVHQPKLLVPLHPKIFFKRMMQVISYFPNVKLSNYHLSGFFNIVHRNPKLVKQFINTAKNHNVTVSFESNPHIFTSFYPKAIYMPEEFAKFCVENGLPMTMDTSHISDNGFSMLTFFKKYHKQIYMIHLSDYHNGIEHLPLGMGSLPVRELLDEIKRTSWNRIIVFEIKRFPGAQNTKDKIDMLKKSLDMVRKYT